MATMSDLVFANYCMASQQVSALATSQAKSLCKSLVTTTVDASTPVVFGHAELPAYQDEVTLSFWAKISPQVGSTNVPLVLKGTVASPELGVILLQSGTGVTVPVMTQKYPTMEGIITSSATVTQEWMHFCLVVSSGSAVLYVNGTQSDQATLSMDLASVFADLNVGGFVGSLNGAKFCNYAASAAELPFLMGQHPDTALNQQLTAAFQKAGCIGSPYGIDTDPGAASDLKTLLLNNQAAQVDIAFATIKTDADKYLQGEHRPIQQGRVGHVLRRFSVSCRRLRKRPCKDNQPQASCLPTAPFSCPAPSTIGDFDIRTHPDILPVRKHEQHQCATNTGNRCIQLHQDFGPHKRIPRWCKTSWRTTQPWRSSSRRTSSRTQPSRGRALPWLLRRRAPGTTVRPRAHPRAHRQRHSHKPS